MAATAQIIIEVDDKGATNAFKQINAEAGKLGPTLQPVQRISEQTFNNIESGALRARESAALLGEEFGVKIPRALRGTIAQAAGIGSIFSAAFSGLAVLGFIEIAKVAGEKIAGVAAEMLGWGEATKKAMEAQGELNKVFIEANDHIDKLRESYRLIGLSGLPLVSEKQAIANENFDAAKKKVADLTAELAKLQKQSKETHEVLLSNPATGMVGGSVTESTEAARKASAKIGQVSDSLARAQAAVMELGQATKNAGKEFDTTFAKDRAEEIKKIARATEEASAKLDEMASAARKGGLTGIAQIDADAQAQIAAVEKVFSKEPALAAQASATVTAISAEASRKRISYYEVEYQKKTKMEEEFDAEDQRLEQQRAERQRRMEDQTLSIERQAAIAIAPPWERANAAITANYEERMARIREMVATGDLDELHAARQQTAALQELYAQRRDELVSQMERLFDDITSGNIKKRFLDMFKKMVFEMVAQWILGMQQMRGASQQTMNGSGGILGAIFGSLGLGGIFGGRGSGSQAGISSTPGVITNFSGGNGDFGGETNNPASIAVGLSAGMGGGPGTTMPSGAGPAATGLSKLMGKIFSNSLSIGGMQLAGTDLATLGIGLLGMSFGKGGVMGGLGGAAGGALLGFSIGGPLGALVGGIAGLFAGLFQHSTRKARLAIEADIKSKAATIEDAYNLFQTDWTGSRDALEQLRQAGVDALKQAGVKDISRSRVGHVDQWIDKAEKEIDLTQAERNRRAALTFGPAQFRIGGFVGAGAGGPIPSWFAGTAMHFATGGAVPAILHEGEYVMRPEAVSRYGRARFDQMNSGSSGGDVHIHLSAWDGKSVKEWLDADGAKKIVNAIRRGQHEGAW